TEIKTNKFAETRDKTVASKVALTDQTYLAVGENLNGINRSYLWFKPPGLTSGARILNAQLKLHQYVNAASLETFVDVHPVLQPWGDEMTWSTKPTHGATIASANSAKNGSVTGEWVFDITTLVQQWYEGEVANYGIVLMARGKSDVSESIDRRAFNSSESGGTIPKLEITYVTDQTGAENFWSYVGNVGLSNGNFLLSDIDVYLPGRGIPITVSRSYNSRSIPIPNKVGAKAPIEGMKSILGSGWLFNFEMRLKYKDPANSKIILFIDGDGSKHIFTEPEGQIGLWQGPPGIQYKLTYKAAEGTNPAYYILTDQTKTKYYFDFSTGKLEAIFDSNDNILDVAYTSDGTLQSITDASGRTIRFTFSANGKLDTIKGTEIPTVKYTYYSNGQLRMVQKLDAANNVKQQVSYEYDSQENLITAYDPNANPTSIGYIGEYTLTHPKGFKTSSRFN
ncbi:DNRLRE domain-containing protein, partial [Schinkia azotoformans]